MDRPIPELAPVTIAFWPLSNLRFSIFGTTGFGKSIKLFSEYGTLGLGRLAASGGIAGMVFSFLVLRIRRDIIRFLTSVVAGGVDPGGPGRLPCGKSAGVIAAGYRRNSSISPCQGQSSAFATRSCRTGLSRT